MRPIILFFAFLMMLSLSSCATRVVTRPSAVTVVKTRPANYKIVKVKGKRYYFWNGNHYRKTRNGYVITRL
ncbi:hypothetical protein L3X39_03260 [Sabulilitoribacter multivorans]|uniref:Lipoprotein n=1 Tax=Flaviramulus multivorans TaxID=1304750 RepID=A0ABS9IHL5_9FLAO|nr:DUF6515 family protein [Flaviramulus multivorans]MCF7559642.1 hypothetical protein [Flaviramulus multivorans]